MTSHPAPESITEEVSARHPAAALARASAYLARHDVDAPRVTAERILASVLGTDRTQLATSTTPLSPEQAKRYGAALCTRCDGVPTQHITGTEGFRYLDLTVRPGVLVPRPETEVVVDVALGLLSGQDEPIVVDVGTGTGAIALSIASEHPGAQVIAVDIAPAAIDLAQLNARAAGVEGVTFVVGDLLPLPSELEGRVDLIVSNPPYLTLEGYAAASREVRADPIEALVGGTEVHARLAGAAPAWLRPGGSLVMEIGDDQGPAVHKLLTDADFQDVTITKDLAGRDRVVGGHR